MPTFTPVTLETLPAWALELLEGERVARLAYVDSRDRPRLLPVTFALAGGVVWSAIDEKPKRTPEPARLRHLGRRPEAALLVDVYDDDWSKLAWVQLLGVVAIVPAPPVPEPPTDVPEHPADVAEQPAYGREEPAFSTPAALAALGAKYPQYRDRRPPGPLLGLTVERTLHWRAAG